MKLIKDLGMIISSEKNQKKYRFGIYECPYCYINFKTRTSNVKNGNSTKCKSCHMDFKNITHGKSDTIVYTAWSNIKQRCFNPKSKHYNYYGGRGITVCNEWVNDFKAFYDWAMANRYNDNLQIDRIDNDGNYEPSNCRWTTKTIQAQNTRILRKNNTSGYRGVSKSYGLKYLVRITVNYINIYLGVYDYPWTSAYVYDSYIIKNNLEHTRNFTKDLK